MILFFFPSGAGVSDVFVRLSLIKQVIKEVSLVCFSCLDMFEQYLHLSVFSKHWKYPTFSFSQIYIV